MRVTHSSVITRVTGDERARECNGCQSIEELLKSVLEKVNVLPDLNEKIVGISKTIGELNLKTNRLDGEMKATKNAIVNIHLENDDVRKTMLESRQLMLDIEAQNKKNIDRLNSLENYGRRENLIFYGIPEGKDDERENCDCESHD